MKTLPLLISLLCPTGLAADTISIPFDRILDQPDITGTFLVSDITPQGDGRCALSVTARVPSLFDQLDAMGRARENMGGNTHRLYWVGPTNLTSANGNTITMSSRARYELWGEIDVLFDTIKTKILQDTKTVDLLLVVDWDAAANALSLRYDITNIRNFPGEVEGWLRTLGVDFGGQERLTVPQNDTLAELAPEIIAGPAFAAYQRGLDIRVDATLVLPNRDLVWGLSVDSCITLQSLVQNDAQKATDLVLWLITDLSQ